MRLFGQGFQNSWVAVALYLGVSIRSCSKGRWASAHLVDGRVGRQHVDVFLSLRVPHSTHGGVSFLYRMLEMVSYFAPFAVSNTLKDTGVRFTVKCVRENTYTGRGW